MSQDQFYWMWSELPRKFCEELDDLMMMMIRIAQYLHPAPASKRFILENKSYFGIPRVSLAARNSIDRSGKWKTIEDLIENLEKDIIGSGSGFWGPLGWNKYTYLDHTASGKGLHSIENFIQSEVLPHYANTHTTVSHTSLQTTNLRTEARNLIKLSVGACDDDEAIFCGSGANAAVHKLLHCIVYPKTRKLIVFVGPFEHHSNILPWREAASKVAASWWRSPMDEVRRTWLGGRWRAITEREEGGTPDIIGSIRLGLVFRFRNIVGIGEIVEKEAVLCRKALQAWRDVPEIHILGSLTNPRLPIISLMIRHQRTGYFLHHNFVVALLNDLFGIQCRGGCMCAGPYAQSLLGVDDKLASYYSQQLKLTQNSSSVKHGTILKPGFVRISLNFHTSQEELQFVIDAVKLVARHGWKLLPCYNICRTTGTFQLPKKAQVTTFDAFVPLLYTSGVLSLATSSSCEKEKRKFTYTKCLEAAKSVLTSFIERTLDLDYAFVSELLSMADFDYRQDRMRNLRWFMVSYESFQLLSENHRNSYDRITNSIRSLEPFQPILQGDFGNPNNASSRKGSIPSLLLETWTKCSNDHHQTRSSTINFQKSIWEKLCNQLELDKGIDKNVTAGRISLSSSGFEEENE